MKSSDACTRHLNMDDALRSEVRKVVDAGGEDAPRELYRIFDMWNAKHFGGKLRPAVLWITPTSSARALADYAGKDPHGIRSVVRIAPRVLGDGLNFAGHVLLHEMVHAYVREVLEASEPGYRGHGPIFAAECNRIGAFYAWAEVGVKGRGGKPDCAQWPLNVSGGLKTSDAPSKKSPRRDTKKLAASIVAAIDAGDLVEARELAEKLAG